MKTKQLGFALLLAFLTCTIPALASVPAVINYQGRLTLPSGTPVADSTYSMTFYIYDAATGGNVKWSETNSAVQVKGGLFAAMLGSVTSIPANIFDSPTTYFAVKVENDLEMTPRQQIASVGYAQVAGNGHSPGAIITYGGSTAPTGWLICDGSAVSRTGANAALFATIGTTYGTGDSSSTFNLPDLRGVFPKGAGTTNRALGKDATGSFYAATLGTYRQDSLQGHKHTIGLSFDSPAIVYGNNLDLRAGRTATFAFDSNGYFGTVTAGGNDGKSHVPVTDDTNGPPRTGPTTEPQSLGVTFIIKT